MNASDLEAIAQFFGRSMRDIGLEEAIRAAGGITELARRIGISQPSVSNWDRVPAERVLAVLHEQIRREGAACVLVTHSAAAAARADRTVTLTSSGIRS